MASGRRGYGKRRGAAPARGGLVAVCVAAAGLLLLSGGALWLLGGSSPEAVGGQFALVAADGRAVSERSFGGRVLLIYFGYTGCRDVCPTTLVAVGQAMEALGARADAVQPIFVTVDPGRDTPEVLRRFVAGFSPRLVGLTGTPGQIRAVERQYRVSAVPHAGADGVPGVDHSSVLVLVGTDGRYLGAIRADESGAEMAAAIARHLS